ncbi:glycerol-3-phosphate acyltransferase [Thermopolyspora sp. NPDC052614]|uniref:glycerol-3-phosphate acyltransferase n=1 Tax=Thermopolyspora sp. NPDC052614 TaxID=3155682 RepID=UPI00341591E6
MIETLLSFIGGYLAGSVPVALLVGRAHGFDPREVGDRNPGFWNVKERLGARHAVPVFVGDLLKGTAAGLLGLSAGGWQTGDLGVPTGASVVPVYAAVAGAMIGHAWPIFARFRGGRSVLTFAGGMAVICPPAFALAVLALVVVSQVTRSFAIGARVAVFAIPALQALFTPLAQVAATGALMCLIGLRFGQAALAARRRSPRRAGAG